MNFYDKLLKAMESCIVTSSWDVFSRFERILMIAINEEQIMRTFFSTVEKFGRIKKYDIVAQPKMQELLDDMNMDNIRILGWRGDYQSDLLTYLSNHLKEEPDAFVFFCDSPNNLRNKNIMQIASGLRQGKMEIFSMNHEGDLFCYTNMQLFLRGIEIYDACNAFIRDACEEGLLG